MPGYTLPDGKTLKNKLGAKTPEQLAVREADQVKERALSFRLGNGPKGQFDIQHLKSIHKHLFQDVYEWAGRTRDEQVKLSDKKIATEPTMRRLGRRPFSPGPVIQLQLNTLMDSLKKADFLRGLPRSEFAERAADAMAALNNVHPFREGNGRAQRVFMEELAAQAGHTLDFSVVSKERMIQASVVAHEDVNPSMMRRMFEEISDPGRTVFLRKGIAALQTVFDRDSARTGTPAMQWNDWYVASLDPAHATELVFIGLDRNDDLFMAGGENAVFIGHVADLPNPPPLAGKPFIYGPDPDGLRTPHQPHGLPPGQDRGPDR